MLHTQWVACLTVDPGFASLKLGHITFIEITHEINLHLLIQKWQLSVTGKNMCTKYWLMA